MWGSTHLVIPRRNFQRQGSGLLVPSSSIEYGAGAGALLAFGSSYNSGLFVLLIWPF
jgi:hypothetical protein